MKRPKWDPVKSMYYDEQHPDWFNPMDWSDNGLAPFKGRELTTAEKLDEVARHEALSRGHVREAQKAHGLYGVVASQKEHYGK